MKEKLYVPIMYTQVNEKELQNYITLLKGSKADAVFLCPSRESFYAPLEEQTAYFKEFAENAAVFRKNGFGIGVWITTLGFGGPLSKEVSVLMEGEPHITNIDGITSGDAFCPEGEKLKELCARHVQTIATFVKPDMIMFDDEYCLNVRPGLGCFCEKHLALYEKALGRKVTREELKERIFTGYDEKFRKLWLKLNGDSLRNFAKTMRDALDEVAPDMRLGYCSGFTSWDMEGVDAIELAKIMAGNTKPFLRLTGAPYWVARHFQRFAGQTLGEIIEFARAQESWSRGSGVEIFNEGDSYPRPRYVTPAALTETFDVALRASGNMGALKYLFCYDAPPSYDLGYWKRHVRNLPFYEFIEKHFDGKKTVGVQVFEEQFRFKDERVPETFMGEAAFMERSFSRAGYFLSHFSIPTVYGEETDCAVVFGQSARYLEKLPKKLILDVVAAQILQERGFDTGLRGKKEVGSPTGERVGETKYRSIGCHYLKAYDCTLDSNAKVESYFTVGGGAPYEIPATYRYESGGTEFLVLTADTYASERPSSALRSYYRQTQLLNFIGRAYPYIEGMPGIYTICKDGEENGKPTRAVLFVNICEDDLFDFTIKLDKDYSSFEAYGIEGELCGREIKVKTTVAPYGAFAIVLTV